MPTLAIGTALLILTTIAAETMATNATDTGLCQLTDVRGLTNPVYRWNARLVWPAEKPASDDIRNTNMTEWNFDDNTTAGITFHALANPQASEGVLKFTTQEGGYFYWGSHFDDDNATGLNLEYRPLALGYRGRAGLSVRMRIRQSLTESHWTLSARRAGSPPELWQEKITLKGTNWQEIGTVIVPKFGFDKAGPRYHSLCFEPGESNNQMEIDWVRVAERKLICALRKTIECSQPVQSATLCLLPQTDYHLYLNGQKLASGTGNSRRACHIVDLSTNLAIGKNIIAWEIIFNAEESYTQKLDEYALAMEGIIHFTNGTFQRFYTDGSERACFNPPENWTSPQFDDTNWQAVIAGQNIAESTIIGAGRDGMGVFVDPPYMGPIQVKYINALEPENAHPFFRQTDGIALNITLPQKSGVSYTVDYKLADALTEQEISAGQLASVDNISTAFAFTYQPQQAGVYMLHLTAKANEQLLDTRLLELAVAGKIPQKAVPWQDVEKASRKRLITEINCGNPADPHEFVEHPYYTGSEPVPTLPDKPMTQIIKALGQPCRETAKGYGHWFGYRVTIEHSEKPHFVEVEYPDDRPQSFAVRAYYKGRAEHRAVGDLAFSSPTIWVLNDPTTQPLTHRMQTAYFLFYPRRHDLAIEVTNLQRDKPSAIARLRVYEVEELAAPHIPHAEPERLFGSQTERAPLILRSFYGESDYERFAYLDGGTYRHWHTGWFKRWFTAISEQIRYMRYSGENAFFCNLYQYGGQVYWPIRTAEDRGSVTPYTDLFPFLFAMFEANELTFIPQIEFCYSHNILMHNRYTDREIRDGAPSPIVVSKDGRQMTPGGDRIHYNTFSKIVLEEMEKIIGEVAERYGKYSSFKGLMLVAGGLFLPTVYNNPKAADWREMLEYGWEDDTIRLFEERTGIKVPVDFSDPERFAKRFRYITENHRNEWLEFRCRELQHIHERFRNIITQHKPDAKYYLLLATAVPIRLAEYSVLQGQSIYEGLRIIGQDPLALKTVDNLQLGWVYTPESFNCVNHQTLPGTLGTFNRTPELNRLFDAGENSAAFINPVWQEPDIHNTLHTNWVWAGASQQNPNPLFGHRYYREPFVERLIQQTPGTLIFVFTDGHLYTAQSELRRPFAVAYRSLPIGTYHTLEGAGLDKNIVVRELVKNEKRYICIINPAWWQVSARLQFSGTATIHDRVNDVPLTMDKNGVVELELDAYDIKVLEMATTTELKQAETKIDPEGQNWLAKQRQLLDYWCQLGTEKTIAQLGFEEPVDLSSLRGRAIQGDYETGYFNRVLDNIGRPIILELLNYLEGRQKKEAAGQMPKPQAHYRVILGRDQPYTDHAGRIWLPDQPYHYGLEAYGYLGRASVPILRGAIPIENTTDPEIYRGERFRFDAYCFRVPNGRYRLRLHFAENFNFSVGDRLVDIFVNTKPVLKKFDFNAAASAFRRAYIKEIDGIEVTGGELTISGKPTYNFKLNAIEVEPDVSKSNLATLTRN